MDHTRARIQRGRPKLRELFASVREPASDVMVMACGPEALILDASDHAFTHGFAFHTEVFHF